MHASTRVKQTTVLGNFTKRDGIQNLKISKGLPKSKVIISIPKANTLKSEYRRTKRESFKKFCKDLHSSVLTFLMNPNGSFMESSNETLEQLMTTHIGAI